MEADKISVNFPPALHKRLLEASQAHGCSKSEIILKATDLVLSVMETYPYLLKSDEKRLAKNGKFVGNIMVLLDNF